jgi:hypothetical protein
MGEFFPDRLEPAGGVTALESQHSRRDQRPPQRRRAPQPSASPSATTPQIDAETLDSSGEPPHKLDHMA